MGALSIFGTRSDAGKSTLAFVIAKLLQEEGYKVAPFKAQNVSNNSRVGDDNKEIAIPQYFASKLLAISPTYHINPILLKSGKGNSSSLILEGKSVGSIEVTNYFKNLDTLKPMVDRSLDFLKQRYEIIVAEGAGSPVELNLMDKDLSNIYTARSLKSKIILVADIEKGGVFASIWGVYNLLPSDLRKDVIGVIVNKFRGDLRLFDEGVKIIEKEFKIPVLGVIAYTPFFFAYEDAQSINNYTQNTNYKIKVGVIAFPHISNYNDFEPLIIDEEVRVDFITSNLNDYDAIFLPGSKRVVDDLLWLKELGLDKELKDFTKPIFGICGGYEILHNKILDPKNIEGKSCKALGFIDGEIIFQEEKVLKNGEYNQFGLTLQGFEIHHGKSEYEFFDKGDLGGTFLHGIFENDNFRNQFFRKIDPKYRGYQFQKRENLLIDNFLEVFRKGLDLKRIVDCLQK